MSEAVEPNRNTQQQTPMLALPYTAHNGDDENAAATTTTITVGGASVTLDRLGPVVINVDGTIARITNWDKMTEAERSNTLRLVARRNKERLQNLAAQDGPAGAQLLAGAAST
ncbi:hypothetical protein HDU84_002484 [Entophlyctis sp. JEL0112]|nr:hypothetical protein HDU84_002484 [Entophlyctis sp. JEL0112]